MPRGIRKALGVLLLLGTIGLSTCQSLWESVRAHVEIPRGSVQEHPLETTFEHATID